MVGLARRRRSAALVTSHLRHTKESCWCSYPGKVQKRACDNGEGKVALGPREEGGVA